MTDKPRDPTENPQSPSTRLSRRRFVQGSVLAAASAASPGLSRLLAEAAQGASSTPAPSAARPLLYMIATAHNDTQWNWTVQDTINKFIPNTVRLNNALFDKYPHYNFNYEGVIHYMFCKEYHPDLWNILKERVAQGRWKLSGSWINAVDVNIPSAESLFRQALYGQAFFRKEFGMVSRDLYLPDCFGFPASLPTIGRHSGLAAFSTQKLTWGCWIPAPFAVGRWEGVDGSSVVASLRPGAYVTRVRSNPATDPKWHQDWADAGGEKVDLRYFGTGDQGGAPDEESVRWVNQAVADQDAPVRVLNTSADQLARDLSPEQIAALPSYKGELLLRLHAVGCYTSHAEMKRWNRENEQLADAAERASVIADWLEGLPYPRRQLTDNWIRVLWHQFHDDVTGTCIPQAYTFSWNDELIALNGFAAVLAAAVAAAATAMDTRVEGIPLLVYNPLAVSRSDTVEAAVHFPGEAPAAVRVFDTQSGMEVPSQVITSPEGPHTILFLADMPSTGFKVFDLQPSETPCLLPTGLAITSDALENSHYRAKIDENGDIASLFDKAANKEMLAAPARIQFLNDPSPSSPAWEILYSTVTSPPREFLQNPTIRIVEHGPARVSLEITRMADGSTWVQRLRLTPRGTYLEIENQVDWKTPGTLVKAAFPMSASNPRGVFDLDLGVIERGDVAPNLWEVPAHQWADLTDAGGGFGLAVLNNCKYGWDKPADNLLRLTLLHTPYAGAGRRYQGVQDIGHHHFTYALAGHAGDWRQGQVPLQAARLNQPLRAFQTTPHPGALGRSFSMLQVSTPQVGVRALKKAEDSEEIVLRLQELLGQPAQSVEIALAAPITAAREINAAEETIGPYQVHEGKLLLDLGAFAPRTFALKLAAPPQSLQAPSSKPVELPFDGTATSPDRDPRAADMDGQGHSIPAELFPARLVSDGIEFHLEPTEKGAKNMLICRGQRIRLPSGNFNRLYLLAASVGGDQEAVFQVHARRGKTLSWPLKIQDWTGLIGQWYSTLDGSAPDGGKQVVRQTPEGKIEGLENLRPAFVKRDKIAWVGTHRHSGEGNEAHILCYLFQYSLDLPPTATSITLPDNPKIRIMAISAAHTHLADTTPAALLYASDLEV